MSETDVQPKDLNATPLQESNTKSHRALSRLKREMTDEELKETGTQKMLLQELERLTDENSELQEYRDNFYIADKELAVTKERLTRNNAMEIISSSCLAIGAASLGYAPSVWSQQPSGWIFIVGGLVLTAGGIAAKAIKL